MKKIIFAALLIVSSTANAGDPACQTQTSLNELINTVISDTDNRELRIKNFNKLFEGKKEQYFIFKRNGILKITLISNDSLYTVPLEVLEEATKIFLQKYCN